MAGVSTNRIMNAILTYIFIYFKKFFMNELLSKHLSQIVNEQHQTASVFEKYNLDYCCRGNRSLQEACDEDHIFLPEVVAELQNIYANKKNELDFNKVKLYQLADYIIYTHHNYVKKELPLILSYLGKVSTEHGRRHNELYKISQLFADLSNEMTHHMLNEETTVFPRIKQLEQYSFAPVLYDIKYFEYLLLPIIGLEDEHEDVGNIMAAIKKLTNNYIPPADACSSFKLLYASLQAFEVDLHHHVHLENSILFPKALSLEREVKLNALNYN
jgi:regulator of cell morphogenesis and NO signaling